MSLSGLIRKVARKPGYAPIALYRTVLSRSYTAPEARKFIADRMVELQTAFDGVSGRTANGAGFGHGGIRHNHAELLWRLVRDRRPARVVETGVCNGLSSAVILEAMAANDHGELVSVDLPEFAEAERNTDAFWEGKGGAVVPPGKSSGWLVPDPRRDRWKLVLGRARDLLPAELAPGCDIFIHDSEHSYENQLFEFRAGWNALRPGGVLVATDINWSSAFSVFCRATRARRQFVDHTCALIFKP